MTTSITETLLPTITAGLAGCYTQALDDINKGDIIFEENFIHRESMGDPVIDEGILKAAAYKKITGLANASMYALITGGCVGFIAGEKAGVITGSIMGSFAVVKGCTHLTRAQIITGALLGVLANHQDLEIIDTIEQSSIRLRESRLAQQAEARSS